MWGQNIPNVHVNFSARRRRLCFSQTTLLPGLFAYADVELFHPCSRTSSYSQQLLIFHVGFFFFGSEIITNERLDALNTWRQCVNNINISVEEQRSLWSLQSLFTAGFYPPVRKSTELLKPCTFQAQLFFFFHGRSVLYQLFPSRIKLFSTSHKFRETAKCHSFSQRNAITSVRNVICNNKLAYLSPESLPSTLPADGHALAANRQHHSLPHIHSLSSRIYSVTLLATAQKRPLQTLLTTIMYEASFIIVCLSWQRNEKPLSFILYKRTSDAAKLT